jgi:hypothetical protein
MKNPKGRRTIRSGAKSASGWVAPEADINSGPNGNSTTLSIQVVLTFSFREDSLGKTFKPDGQRRWLPIDAYILIHKCAASFRLRLGLFRANPSLESLL